MLEPGKEVHYVYYVARGRILEKKGNKDSNNRALTYHNGEIACLHHIIPAMKGVHNENTVISHDHGISSVIPIDVEILREYL